MPIHHRQSGKALFRIFSRTLGLHVSFLTHCQEAAARICRGEVEHSAVGNVEDFTLHGLTLVQIRFSLRQFGQHAGGVAVERVQAVDAKAR